MSSNLVGTYDINNIPLVSRSKCFWVRWTLAMVETRSWGKWGMWLWHPQI